MRAIYSASMRTVEAEALTLSVAIESILPHVYQSKDAVTAEEKEWLQKAKDYLKGWGGPPNLTSRLMGTISMLKELSAMGRLRELVTLGAITDKLRKDWKTAP